jgi:hypothetical protein
LLDQAMMLRHPKSIRHSLLRQLVSDWDHLSASFGVSPVLPAFTHHGARNRLAVRVATSRVSGDLAQTDHPLGQLAVAGSDLRVQDSTGMRTGV